MKKQNKYIIFGGVMKFARTTMLIFIVIFIILGLSKILSFNIVNPIILLLIASIFFMEAIKNRKNNNEISILFIYTALIIYIAIFFIVSL